MAVLTLTQLEALLADALAAQVRLLTGRAEASVSYQGKSVSFVAADVYKLDAYIAGLQRQIDLLSGTARSPGPVVFEF